MLNHSCTADDTFCHGKPLLDQNDLPFTVNRVLCWFLMAIMISPFLVTRVSVGRIRNRPAAINAFFSVIPQPTLWDLVQVNLVVYPTLVSMDRTLRSYLVIDGYTWRFLLAFFILFFVIGGVCNQIGSIVQRQRVVGMGAAFAACLGYYRAVGMTSKSLFRFADFPFSASTIFWLDAAMLFLRSQPGILVAWITGGFAGHAFGELHQQLLAEALRSNMKSAVSKFLNFF